MRLLLAFLLVGCTSSTAFLLNDFVNIKKGHFYSRACPVGQVIGYNRKSAQYIVSLWDIEQNNSACPPAAWFKESELSSRD